MRHRTRAETSFTYSKGFQNNINKFYIIILPETNFVDFSNIKELLKM